MIKLSDKNLSLGSKYHNLLNDFHSGKVIEEIENEELKNLFECYKQNPVEGNIIECEKKFEINIDGIDLPLVGFIDRLDEDKIVEYKTSSFDYKDKDLEDNIQTYLYPYVIWKQTGKLLPIVYSVINKKKAGKPKYQPQVIVKNPDEFKILLVEDKIREFFFKVKEKQFSHNKGSHCYWCSYGPNGTQNCIHY